MLKSILKTLQSIEGLLVDILLELRKAETREVSEEPDPVKLTWLEQGIDNILSYQAGEKRSDTE